MQHKSTNLENPNAHHGTLCGCLCIAECFNVNLVRLERLKSPTTGGGCYSDRFLPLINLLMRIISQAFVSQTDDHNDCEIWLERIKESTFSALRHRTGNSEQF